MTGCGADPWGGWRWLNADAEAAGLLLEFAYFDEFVLTHVFDALSERLISAESFGSHDMRVALALGRFGNQLALSISAMWESGFRRWLRRCAAELALGARVASRIERAPLTDLLALLRDIRGVCVADHPLGARLAELALVGNVVRHGDGVSGRRLAVVAPDLWFDPPGATSADGLAEFADRLVVTDERLRCYADAVCEFWTGISSASIDAGEPPWASAGAEREAAERWEEG